MENRLGKGPKIYLGIGCGAEAGAAQGRADGLVLSIAEQMGYESVFGAFEFRYDPEELLQLAKSVTECGPQLPVMAPVACYDSTIALERLFRGLAKSSIAGVINYPTLSCYEGDFRQALTDSGLTVQKELDGLMLAQKFGLDCWACLCSTQDIETSFSYHYKAAVIPQDFLCQEMVDALRRHPAHPELIVQLDPSACGCGEMIAEADGLWVSPFKGSEGIAECFGTASKKYKLSLEGSLR